MFKKKSFMFLKGYNIDKRDTFQPQTDSHYRPLCNSKLKIIFFIKKIFLKYYYFKLE